MKRIITEQYFICKSCHTPVIEYKGRKIDYCHFCSDGYIRTLLKQKGCYDPPDSLVEVKRAQMLMRRFYDADHEKKVILKQIRKCEANQKFRSKNNDKLSLEDKKVIHERVFSQFKL